VDLPGLSVQLVLVFAAREPAPHLRLADRYIALAKAQDAGVVLCINKADQGVEPWLSERLAVYRGLGYAVVQTSAATGDGIDALRDLLTGKVSAFAGPSGVGKSSLLNALEPDLAQRVAAVSMTTGKGRHTTTGARLVALTGPGGGWLADTAGIRALALDPSTLADLPAAFREFAPYRGACGFSDCRHLTEPRCAVQAAVRAGTIDAERYDSYRRLATGKPASGGFPRDRAIE
jgi:ribosome biogenesis GTPase / thiamine phosphate phosphatase